MGREDGDERRVLCHYFFQTLHAEDDRTPHNDVSSSFLLSSQPTLRELQEKFPFEGQFHFRLQHVASGKPASAYCWLDLCALDADRGIPVNRATGEIRIKVLQLSAQPLKDAKLPDKLRADQVDVPEDRQYDAYFRWQEPMTAQSNRYGMDCSSNSTGSGDVGAVLSGVKKVLASKMKQSAQIWGKVTGSTSGANAAPTAASLEQLAKLVGAMKTPLQESNRDHVVFLNRLWVCCFDAQQFVTRGPAWSRLGFAKEDPLRELEFLLPLHCLVFFHEVHRTVALPMVNDQAAKHTETYPYGLVAAKIAFMVADILQLRDGGCLGCERPFWRMFEDPIAFFELFSIAFRAFDNSWNNASANRSGDLGYHLDATGDFTQELLRRGPDTVPMLVDYAHQMQKW